MVLRYFGIRVTDLERSLSFYTELLGLKKLREGKMHHGGIWVLLEDSRSHQRLELNWYPSDSPFATNYVPGDGLDHIGFKVQDAASTFEKLVAKGAVPAFRPVDKNGVKGIYYLKDPDDNWIEFF
ncbi:MAG: VOC family protein [Nitrososphaerota archaeon]|nr:VOC family protein [Nitrososphaerota archaeon]